MKAEITQIGTVEKRIFDGEEEDVVTNWSFDCSGSKTSEDFIRKDGQQSYAGWSLSELKEISQAAERCPLYKAGVLFS